MDHSQIRSREVTLLNGRGSSPSDSQRRHGSNDCGGAIDRRILRTHAASNPNGYPVRVGSDGVRMSVLSGTSWEIWSQNVVNGAIAAVQHVL